MTSGRARLAGSGPNKCSRRYLVVVLVFSSFKIFSYLINQSAIAGRDPDGENTHISSYIPLAPRPRVSGFNVPPSTAHTPSQLFPSASKDVCSNSRPYSFQRCLHDGDSTQQSNTAQHLVISAQPSYPPDTITTRIRRASRTHPHTPGRAEQWTKAKQVPAVPTWRHLQKE